MSAKSEESAVLEAVARKRLVKTEQVGKGLAGAMVICKMRHSEVEGTGSQRCN